MMYMRWFIYFPINLVMTFVALIITPILAICVVRRPYQDKVKRYGKTTYTLNRYFLWDSLSWFQTFDNACDEYFWGMYGSSARVSIEKYNNSALLRYWYRCCWLWRNPVYGFAQTVLGANPPAWQYRKEYTIFGFTRSINIGWKSHRGFKRLMYAGRIF